MSMHARKEKTVRWKPLGLAAVLSVGMLFTGCGQNATEIQPSVEAAEGPLGAYTDTLMCKLGRATTADPKLPEGQTYEDNAYIRYLKDKLNIGIKDEFEANGDDYDRQVSMAIASGELPDMMQVGSKDFLDELVENDLVEDLTDVYDKYASDFIKGCYDSYDGRSLDTATYDGRLMALPATNGDSAPSTAYIRKDWLDKLGLAVDADGDKCITLDELKLIAKTFMDQDPGGSKNPVGIAFVPNLTADDYANSTFTVNGILSTFKAFPKNWLQDDSGNVYYGSTAPEMKAALAEMAEWFQEGILDPQFGTRTWDDITALLSNGQTGIAFGPWHIPDWVLNSVRGMNKEATFAAYAVVDDAGKVNATHSNASLGYMVVRKGFSNPEALVKMVNLYFDEMSNNANLKEEYPEVSAYLDMGVDGTARPFSMGVYSETSLLDDYADIRKCVMGEIEPGDIKLAANANTAESIKKYLADPENSEVADWSKYVSRMEGIELTKNLTEGDKFNWTSPVFYGITETMKTNNANLGTLEEEAFVAIVTGAKSIDEFDTFVQEWKQQGGDQITQEVQKIVDEKE